MKSNIYSFSTEFNDISLFMNIVDKNIPGIPLSFINALERIFTTNPQSLVQFIVDLFTHKKIFSLWKDYAMRINAVSKALNEEKKKLFCSSFGVRHKRGSYKMHMILSTNSNP